MNVAEVIPYKNHKEKFKLVFQELMKNRYVEVWDMYIYSAKLNPNTVGNYRRKLGLENNYRKKEPAVTGK